MEETKVLMELPSQVGKLKYVFPFTFKGFPCGSDGKASAFNAGDPGSILGLGGSPAEGNGNPLQYSCLGNPMNRRAHGLQYMGSQRVKQQLSNYHCTFKYYAVNP